MTDLHCVHGKLEKQLTPRGLLTQILHLLHMDFYISSTQCHVMSGLCVFIL